tara:strand:+ start:537981 stop:539246 length:1266 start_codon:yes stop_codon:yes gene_type:complete
MASLTKLKQTSGKQAFAVDVVVPGNGRKRIRLGTTTKKDASRFCSRVQSIEDAVRLGSPVRREDEEWLRALPPEQFERIHRTKLLNRTGIPSRMLTLDDWVDQWLGSVAVKRAARTHELYKLSANQFIGFIGGDVSLSGVTRDDAECWNDDLSASGISDASVRRHIRHLKTCFNAAIKRDILLINPFDRIESASIAAERGRIIPDDESERIMDELPSTGFRLLFALARFAGLRSPSETTILEWESIDLEQNRMKVHAPKTHQTRMVPIVPQLRAVLEEAAAKADELTGPILRVSEHNHARTIANAARRAGIELWDRTFQTLRQSFETIMCERFPEHVVAAWTGHSVEVARAHYLTMRDGYFDDASRSIMRSTHRRNEGQFEEARQNGVGRLEVSKAKPERTLRNSPARIRTGDQAIMSRGL